MDITRIRALRARKHGITCIEISTGILNAIIAIVSGHATITVIDREHQFTQLTGERGIETGMTKGVERA